MPHLLRSFLLSAILILTAAAQDDTTTQNGPSALHGAWITGPAANPLSFLNGPAFRTYAERSPYLLPDFHLVAPLNRRLPHWVRFGLEERFRVEFGDEVYALNRLRIQMTLQPVRWLKFVTQAQDSRTLLTPAFTPNRWDLKLAYIEIGNPESAWISFRAGRQLINYNNTLIANSEWRNPARSYDALVTNLHHGPLSLGIFAASVVLPLADGLSHHQQGSNIYGLYGAIDNPVPSSRLEPFVLWRVQPRVSSEHAPSGRQNEKAYGIRFKGLAAKAMDYSAEFVIERGAAGHDPIHASAFTAGAGYRFSTRRLRPRAFTQADWASGDSDPTDGRHGTFDTIYPTTHDRFGLADQFGWQNIRVLRGGLTIEPVRRWTLTAQLLFLSLVNPRDALYNNLGAAIVRDPAGASSTEIGREFDVFTWLELSRHLNVGFGLGHLIPGRFLQLQTPGRRFDTPYFAINFKEHGEHR